MEKHSVFNALLTSSWGNADKKTKKNQKNQKKQNKKNRKKGFGTWTKPASIASLSKMRNCLYLLRLIMTDSPIYRDQKRKTALWGQRSKTEERRKGVSCMSRWNNWKANTYKSVLGLLSQLCIRNDSRKYPHIPFLKKIVTQI